MAGLIRLNFVFLFLFLTVGHSQPLAPTREAQDFTVAYGLYTDGQYGLAYEEFQRFLTRYPASARRPDAAYLAAESLVRLGRTAEAAERFERFIRENRGSRLAGEAQLRLGEIEVGRQDYAAAMERLAPLAGGTSRDLAAEAAYWTGEAWYGLGRTDSALASYQRSIAMNPGGRLAEYAWFAIAWVRQKNGDLTAATRAYDELVARFPKGQLRARAAVRSGEVRMLAGRNEEAITHLTRLLPALDGPDERGEAFYLLGEGHYRQGRHATARMWYDSLLAAVPDHRLARDARYARAWTLMNEGNHAGAATAFLALAGGSDRTAQAAWFRGGVASKLAGRTTAAEDIFRRIAAQSGNEFADDALVELGVMRHDAGQPDSALAFFQGAIVRFPEGDARPRALFMAGEVHRARGRLEEALASYRDARAERTMTQDLLADILFAEGIVLERLGRHDEAIAILSAFLTDFPADAQAGDAWFWLAEAAFHAEDFARADSAYAKAMRGLKGDRAADALYGSAWSKFRQGEHREALALFTRILREAPDGRYAADARLRRADCLSALGDHTAAIAAYRDVLRLDRNPLNLEHARYHLAGSLVRSGQAQAGIREYEALLTQYPRSPLADDARYAIGWVHFQQKNYARAMQDFRSVLRAWPESELAPRVLCSLADAQYNTGEYAAAAATYREVLAKHPESPSVVDAARGVRDSWQALNRDAEGARIVAEFLQAHPDAPAADRLAMDRIEESAAGGDEAAAALAFERFVRDYPSSRLVPSALIGAGHAHEAAGNMPAAEQQYRAVITRFPGSQEAARGLVALAGIQAARNEHAAALASLEQVERVTGAGPLAVEARLERARLLWKSGRADAALTLLESTGSGDESEPAVAKARILRGSILLERKEFVRAEEIFTAVATGRSDDLGAEAQCGAGEVLYAQGRIDAGIAAFARVRYLYPASREWIGEATVRMADGYVLLGQTDKAKELYRSVSEEHGDSPVGRRAAERRAALP